MKPCTYAGNDLYELRSCTVGIAAVNTNRNFIGIELDTEYFNIAEERIKSSIKEKTNETYNSK